MLGLVFTSALLLAITVVIHAMGTTLWLRVLARRYFGPDGHILPKHALTALTGSAVVLMLLHLVEIVIWALAYLLLLSGDTLNTFEKAAYFSAVTFTTLGYGDITLVDHEWRLLSGIEALDGILLVGWSTAFLFMVLQRSWASARA